MTTEQCAHGRALVDPCPACVAMAAREAKSSNAVTTDDLRRMAGNYRDGGLPALGGTLEWTADEIERLIGELDAAEQHVRILQAQVQSFAPETKCDHEWSADRRLHECLRGCGKVMSARDGTIRAPGYPYTAASRASVEPSRTELKTGASHRPIANAYDTISGSAEKATEPLGFGIPNLVHDARKLMAMGFSLEDAITQISGHCELRSEAVQALRSALNGRAGNAS